MAFKLKVVAEAELLKTTQRSREITGLASRWRRDQAKLFNSKLKMSVKRTTLGCFTLKYPELDQQMLEWFSDQREQGEYS